MRDVETPGEQVDERLLLGRRRRRRVEAPDQRDTNRADIEPLGMRADDVALDTPAATLVHGAEPVDEEVVTDVVPPVPETWYTSMPRTIAADCARV